MKILRGKTVALIDPLWIGHHPMYFCQFAASFLRCGACVIGLCPEPEQALDDLRQSVDPDTAGQLDDLVHFEYLAPGKRSFFNGRFEGDPLRTFQRWRNAIRLLDQAETRFGRGTDLAYFPYLDSFLRFLPLPSVPDILLGRPWSGLYLRNHHFGEPPSIHQSLRSLAKGDALLRSRNCLQIGVLDERFIPEMKTLTGRPVIAYPDVTQADLPAAPTALAQQVKTNARGRKIVGMIGLERRKGFLSVIRTAKLARQDNLPFYFVCAGTMNPEEYNAQETREIQETARAIATGTIDNLHFDPNAGRIPSELDYNSLFATFDIAWAAYQDFQGSSGTLSKAAVFEIPTIATAGECIGNRVQSYRIGLTIPEPTPEKAIAALPFLAQATDRDNRPLNPRFEDYRNDHSLARLDSILMNLLESV